MLNTGYFYLLLIIFFLLLFLLILRHVLDVSGESVSTISPSVMYPLGLCLVVSWIGVDMMLGSAIEEDIHVLSGVAR
jgi:hypothetical protein